MPEVRLAWRAALCHGSPGSQVLIGVAPVGELAAVCQTLPRAALRCYDIPAPAPDGQGPKASRGLGASANIFGVLPMVRQARPDAEEVWDTVLTVALREDGALTGLAAEMTRAAAQREHPFVAAIALAPGAERTLFEALEADGPAAGLGALKERVAWLCSRLAAPG